MGFKDFTFLDETSIDPSIIKRDFMEINHQREAQLNDSNQVIDFCFGEQDSYHQIGSGYLELDVTLRKKW